MKKLNILAFLTVLFAVFAAAGCTQNSEPAPTPEPPAEIVKVEDFGVDIYGKVSFTSTAGVTYFLYVDEEKLCEIKNGDDITELVTAEKKSYKLGGDNIQSNEVSVYKTAGITDLKLEGFNLVFGGGENYKLFIGAKTEIAAVSGTDIEEKLSAGANTVYLYADGAREENAVRIGAKSNELSVFVHGSPEFTVNEKGEILFEETAGFVYELSADGSDVVVTRGQNLSDTLNALPAGETEFTLKVTGGENAGNYYRVKKENERAVYKVKKHFAPDNLSVSKEHAISFSGEAESAELFINGNYKATVKSGDNIYKYYDGKNNLVKLVAASDEKGWRSDETNEIAVNLNGFLKVSASSEKGSEVIGEKDGVTVVGTEGLVAEYSEVVGLSGLSASGRYAIRLSVKEGVSAKGFERVIIKFTDVYDTNKGVALYMVNGAKIGFGDATYYAGGAIDTDFSALDPGDFTAVSNPSAALSSESLDLRVKFDYPAKKFYVALEEPTYTWYYEIKSDFGTAEFSADNAGGNVKVSVEYLKTDSESGFVYRAIGDFLVPVTEESDSSGTFYWNKAEGVSVVKGEKTYKNTTLINGTPNNPLKLSGYEIKTGSDEFVNVCGEIALTAGLKLIEFAGITDNENGTVKGDYTVSITDTAYLIRLTDKANPEKVLTIEYKTANWDYVGYFGFIYTNGTKTISSREYDGVPMYGYNFGNTNAAVYNIPKLVYFGDYKFGYHEAAVDFADKTTGENLASVLAADEFGKSGVYMSINAGSAGMFVTAVVNGK